MWLTTSNLDEYEWDYDTGLATLTYEEPYTGERVTTHRQQMRYWVPPRWRVPNKEYNDPR